MTSHSRPKISALKENEKTPDILDIFSEIEKTYGVPDTPPLYTSLANSPTVLKGTWNLSLEVMEKGLLPTAIKQVIFLAVSSARKCQYCEQVYTALCKIDGISGDQIIAAAQSLEDITPKRTQAIVSFAVKTSLDIHNLTDEDYEKLKKHGLNEKEILEIIATTGLATYFNILADGMQVDVDDTIREVLKS